MCLDVYELRVDAAGLDHHLHINMELDHLTPGYEPRHMGCCAKGYGMKLMTLFGGGREWEL